MSDDSIQWLEGDDPEMLAAIRKAQDAFPEFAARAIERRGSSVTLGLTSNGYGEHDFEGVGRRAWREKEASVALARCS